MLLFIAQQQDKFFGGGVITDRNLTICKQVLGSDNVIAYLLPPKIAGGVLTLKSFMTGYLLGLNRDHEIQIIQILESNSNIKFIFIDSSLLGQLAPIVKKKFVNVHIIIFFHNVEFSFFKEFLKTTRRYIHSIGLPAVYNNEKNAVAYADSIITLNRRDSEMLERQYGRASDCIWPISLEDTFDIQRLEPALQEKPLSLLFVGSRFYPNEQGISWFIKEVTPYLKNAKLVIVGRGFEALKGEWASDQVEVIGSCPDIASYYYAADIVVAPIFTGSGMKTKTAEALMFGKTILASTESFEGYDIDKNLIGGEFNSASQYVDYINNYKIASEKKFNIHSRKYFTELYSFSASIKLMSSFFKIGIFNLNKS